MGVLRDPVVCVAVVVTDAFGLAPGLHDRAFAALDVGKQNLGAARLVNFLALAYLVATSPFLGRLARTPAGEALQSLGRHSLAIFAASSLLSALGQAGFAAWGAGAPEGVVKALEFGYTLICIGALFTLARYLQWRKTRDGAPPHGVGGGGSTPVFGGSPRWALAPQASTPGARARPRRRNSARRRSPHPLRRTARRTSWPRGSRPDGRFGSSPLGHPRRSA